MQCSSSASLGQLQLRCTSDQQAPQIAATQSLQRPHATMKSSRHFQAKRPSSSAQWLCACHPCSRGHANYSKSLTEADDWTHAFREQRSSRWTYITFSIAISHTGRYNRYKRQNKQTPKKTSKSAKLTTVQKPFPLDIGTNLLIFPFCHCWIDYDANEF